ncbi:unnamed protein product, partial [Larinioides sclopetarius]
KNIYCFGLDDITKGSRNREDPRAHVTERNVWLNHKIMYQIMGDISKGRWDKYMPATNIIWLKYMNENILNYLQKNNPHSPPEENQMKALRLLKEWNDCILGHKSAEDLLNDVISKNNPIISAQE